MLIKSDWQIKKLGEVCEVLDSKRKPITKRDRTVGEYPYYGATGILDYVHDYIFDEKLILIGEDGAKWGAGENTAFIAKGKYWVNNHAHVIRPNRSVVLDNWLVYFLNFSDLQKYISGLTVQKLNQEKMRGITFPLPPLFEQKRIVSVLDEIFVALTQAKENAEKNLQNAHEIFESYLQGVFANSGNRWEEKKLMVMCEIRPSKNEARVKLKDTDIVSFVPMEDLGIKQKWFVPVKERTLKEVEGSYTYFADGDVLLAKITPCFENGKLGIASNLKNGIGFGSSEFIVFRTNKGLSSEFLYYYLLREEFRQEGSKRMMGAVGHKRVSKEFIESSIITFPDIFEQKQVVEKLNVLSNQTKKLEAVYQQKLVDLEELKKSILQKAFNGELIGACS